MLGSDVCNLSTEMVAGSDRRDPLKGNELLPVTNPSSTPCKALECAQGDGVNPLISKVLISKGGL